MKPPEGMKIELLPMDETDRVRNEVRCKVTVERRVLSDAELDTLVELANAATPGPWKVWAMEVLADPVGDSNLDTALPVARTTDGRYDKPRTFNADFVATADPPTVLALVAALKEAREQRDLRATQVEEALSIVQQFSIRLDDFMLDELLSVLDDGPCDDEMGRVIPSPLRAERDVVVARLTAIQALVEGHEICSDWRFVDNIRAALGDAS